MWIVHISDCTKGDDVRGWSKGSESSVIFDDRPVAGGVGAWSFTRHFAADLSMSCGWEINIGIRADIRATQSSNCSQSVSQSVSYSVIQCSVKSCPRPVGPLSLFTVHAPLANRSPIYLLALKSRTTSATTTFRYAIYLIVANRHVRYFFSFFYRGKSLLSFLSFLLLFKKRYFISYREIFTTACIVDQII